jgi:hypothetical protein
MHWYRDVDEAEVNQETFAAARDAAHQAAKALGIAVDGVVWFTDAVSSAPGAYSRVFRMKGECRGLQKRVWLHIGLSGDDLLNTVGHEVRHRWQYEHGVLHPLGAANSAEAWTRAEADASQFARKFVNKYTGRSSGTDQAATELLGDLQAALAAL